ncbi:MAG TPA: VWA domain-containing protein [Pyrinomonadaceae bacterium]|nr:VWA domain-containing protein [Pyrinomonadaceae bacterium]
MAEIPDDKKQTFTGLAAKLGRLPADKRRVALEMSAALAAISLKVSREFVEAVPQAAEILSADDLRAWGELGRRLAMGSAGTGVSFFSTGVDDLAQIPEAARDLVFQIATRQLVLSSSTALETYAFVPGLARDVADDVLFTDILKLALEIASRSAKHSADFLQRTPQLVAQLNSHGERKLNVAQPLLRLASIFAGRTGGMTADLWSTLPGALEGLAADDAIRLAERAAEFIEFGGSVTLHFITSGGSVLRNAPAVFDEWSAVARKIARQGNAVLIAFLRATPKLFKQGPADPVSLERVLNLTGVIAETDAESALAAFRSSSFALKRVTIDQFEAWVTAGLRATEADSPKSRRSYFALETRQSNAILQNTRAGLHLEDIQNVLRIYIEGLTGKTVEIAPISNVPQETRIGDGKTVHLPSSVSEFEDEDKDFRLYKVLAAHGAGQIEFGTFEKDGKALRAAYVDLKSLYDATAEQRDAFSLDGYLDVIDAPPSDLPERLPKDSDYRAVLKVFPEPRLARKIFGTMENARIDSRLRNAYRGLRKDLDLMKDFLRQSRPYIFDVPAHLVPFELLFQITLCGGATDDARQFYGQVVSEIEGVVESYLERDFYRRDAETPSLEGETEENRSASLRLGGENLPTVADAIMATSRVYNLFQNISPEQTQESENDSEEEKGEYAYEDKQSAEAVTEEQVKREERPKEQQDIRDLFNAWNSMDDEGEPEDIQGTEAWSQHEMPEQMLEPDDLAFAYDEWDRELNDYRVGWSRVIEKKVKKGDRNFVELARSRYRGVISSIRHQFQLMKPENLTRINRELDGEDYDLNALVEFVIDRKADGRQSENIYTKRLRKQRDVAVSILLDQSSSTARTITRNPLQPYTYPGRRIIEIEKEGLVLMSEALEAVGDVYSINGFTSEGRRNVKFYVVKDFGEKYSEEIERRIGGITFQNNTRLGAAVRHAAHKLLRQEARTKLLIILTDGRPYDHDYGDARYAREDVREALTEAKISGITPFCITIDRESEAELRDLYGDVGYTIIDDVLSLPERMPNIYRRLTS